MCGLEYESEDALLKHLRDKHGDEVKLEKLEHPRKVLPKPRRKKAL